jgi:hypothetical protein
MVLSKLLLHLIYTIASNRPDAHDEASREFHAWECKAFEDYCYVKQFEASEVITYNFFQMILSLNSKYHRLQFCPLLSFLYLSLTLLSLEI